MISVVIPTFRNQRHLRELLDSLDAQVTLTSYEVLVIANLPELGLKKIVESYGPHFRFHETGRIGVNLARNKGLERARGSVVVFLDDDTYASNSGFLQAHFDAHERHPEAIAIGGSYKPKSSPTPFESAYHWILHHGLMTAVKDHGEARWLRAGNVSFKARLLEPAHRFDDRNTFGSSEVSLFARLRVEHNLFLLLSALELEHRFSLSALGFVKRAYYQGYGQGLLSSNARPTERPHWNSIRPFNETTRQAGICQSLQFKIACKIYVLLWNAGARLGNAHAAVYAESLNSKKIIYVRPELTILKAVTVLLLGSLHRQTIGSIRHHSTAIWTALRAAVKLAH